MYTRKKLTAIILLIAALNGNACLHKNTSTERTNSVARIENKNSSEEKTASSTVEIQHNRDSIPSTNSKNNKSNLPPNWPWRGISIESKNTTGSDIDYLASVNVNFVRIQLKPSRRTLREKGDPKNCFYKEIAWADSMLDKCKEHGITAVLAFNFLVLDPALGIEDKSAIFWEQQSFLDSTYRMVGILARHFSKRGAELSCYEVIGEPAVKGIGGAKTPQKIELFYQQVLKEIRKTDTSRWFLLTPGPWGHPTSYEGFEPYNIKDDKLIYGAHMYLPDAFTHQGVKDRKGRTSYPGFFKGEYFDKTMIRKKFSYLSAFEKKYNYPIYIGEFQSARWSEGADQWVQDVLETIDSFGWAWSYFAYEPGQNFWDPFYDVKNPNDAPEKRTIEFIGPTTKNWKFMISEYKKNKK